MKLRAATLRRVSAAAVASAVALALAGCGAGSDDAASADGLPSSIPIGIIVPTSGALATFGDQVVAGVEAGVKYVEDEGILGDSTIELKVQDTASEASTSASLMQAAAQDGTVAVVGSPISNEALAAGPIANSAKIPYLATASPGPHLPALGEYVYAMTTPQGVMLADYVSRLTETDPKVSVIFASDNDTTVNLNKVLTEAVPDAGGELVSSVSTTLTATDSRVVATKAMEGNPDAIGVLSGGPQLPALVSELRSLGFEGRIFANGGADVSAPAAGAAVNGLEFQGQWAPNVDSPLSKPFADAMKATNPDVTPHYPAIDGFNSIRLIAEALAEADSTSGEELVAAIQSVGGSAFESPGGEVQFTGDGNRQLESPVYDLVVQDGVVSAQE